MKSWKGEWGSGEFIPGEGVCVVCHCLTHCPQGIQCPQYPQCSQGPQCPQCPQGLQYSQYSQGNQVQTWRLISLGRSWGENLGLNMKQNNISIWLILNDQLTDHWVVTALNPFKKPASPKNRPPLKPWDQNLINQLLLAPQIVIKWSVSTLCAQRSLLLYCQHFTPTPSLQCLWIIHPCPPELLNVNKLHRESKKSASI